MDSLKQEKRWCLWKRVERDGRTTKVPFCNVSRMSKSNTPELWLTYDQAQRLIDENDGVFSGKGIFLSVREDGLALCAIDIDAHETDHNPLTEEILAMFSGTYAELSPSGRGYHIIFTADFNQIPRDEAGNINYRINNRENELEVYVGGTTNKYMTYSADRISETEQVTDQTAALLLFLEKYMKKSVRGGRQRGEHTAQHVTLPPPEYTPTHDINIEERLSIARRAKDGEYFKRLYDRGDISNYDNDASKADFALLMKLAYWLEGDIALIDRAFRSSALMRDKWDEKRGDTTWGGMEIEAALERCETFYEAPVVNGTPQRQWYDDLGFHSMDAVTDQQDVSAETGEIIKPEDVLAMINALADDEAKQDTISVLPLMCGTGKSSAIRLKIIQTIEANDGDGLLIMTDNLDRMRDYLTPADDEMRQFFLDHGDKILAITPDVDVRRALAEMHRYPVLIMTTQRYIKSSREMIGEYLNWDGGTRPLILVDEKPCFFEQMSLTLDSFSQVHNALHEGLPLQSDEEDWAGPHGKRHELCEDWIVMRNHIEQSFDGFNGTFSDLTTHYLLWKPNWQPEELFERVFAACERYKNQLNRYNADTYTDIFNLVRAIHRMFQSGCVMSFQRQADDAVPIKTMWVMIDHFDCYTDLNAKVVILDGTADISTEYQMDYRVEVCDCKQYRRRLDRMTIDIVDMPTGKTALSSSTMQQRQVVADTVDYLDRSISDGATPAIFTYQFLARQYERRYYPQNVAYFGIIRGSNEFRDKTHIAQVGMNRYQNPAYFLYELEMDSALRIRLMFMEYAAQSDVIWDCIKRPDSFTRKVMYQELLAELEQNIFRGTIRKALADDSYTFYLFTPHRDKRLLDAIHDRFAPLGARVEYTKTETQPSYHDMRETFLAQDMTKLKDLPHHLRIAIWHDRMIATGDEYTVDSLGEALGLTKDQINKAREVKEELNGCFKSEKIGGRPVKFKKNRDWSEPEDVFPF